MPDKLADSHENGLGATWVVPEQPPDYSEQDPLRCDGDSEGVTNQRFGSITSESTGSFWDEDDDVSEVDETGANWSGGFKIITKYHS